MINLHTRAFCDECGRNATVQVGVVFFCDICNPVPCETGNAPAASSSAPSPGALPLAQSNSQAARCAPERSPASPCVTGMSHAEANAGGEHEEVAPRPISSDEKSAACESTSLIAVDEIVDVNGGRVTGDCSAISCGVNRIRGERQALSESNAGLETGVTGGESAATNSNLLTPNVNASSCPARVVSGASKDHALIPTPTGLLPFPPKVSVNCGGASASPPFFSQVPDPSCIPERTSVAAEVSTADAATVDPSMCGFDLDFDAEIDALEVIWARAARNARAFRVTAAICSFPADNSKSVSGA